MCLYFFSPLRKRLLGKVSDGNEGSNRRCFSCSGIPDTAWPPWSAYRHDNPFSPRSRRCGGTLRGRGRLQWRFRAMHGNAVTRVNWDKGSKGEGGRTLWDFFNLFISLRLQTSKEGMPAVCGNRVFTVARIHLQRFLYFATACVWAQLWEINT